MERPPRIVPCAAIFSGDRNWTGTPEQRQRIKDCLLLLKRMYRPVYILHGDCRGVDRIAGEEAKKLGLGVYPHPFKKGMGNAGGPVRNAEMAEKLVVRRQQSGMFVVVYIFHDEWEKARGSRSMMKEATIRNIEVRRG